MQVEADFGVDDENDAEEEEEQEALPAGAPAGTLDQSHAAPAGDVGGIEGLPEGELLSPEKEQPQIPQAEAEQISSKLGSDNKAGAAAEGGWDGWDAEDAQGDWGDS